MISLAGEEFCGDVRRSCGDVPAGGRSGSRTEVSDPYTGQSGRILVLPPQDGVGTTVGAGAGWRNDVNSVLVDARSLPAAAVLHTIDSIVRERVLVFGSLPPRGRDLDLLVSSADADAIASRLRKDGFISTGNEWALFRDCAVRKIDLVQAEEWNLPAREQSAVFSEGHVLNGFTNVVEPSPHHALLILARRLQGGPGPLDLKHRRRIDDALAKDPQSWQIARERAYLWNAETALVHLESLIYERKPVRRWPRVRRPMRTFVISLSGVDGAGKSSQAEALRDCLDQLGFDPVLEWTPVHVLNLDFLTRPVRRLLGVGPPSKLPDRVSPDFRPSTYPAIVAHVWVTVAAIATALSLWRSIWRYLGRGKVVICDRFTLDFAVFLEYRHGEKRDFRIQTWLLRALAPRAFCSFLLDVRPEAALDRKEDQYSVEELERQVELYRAKSARFGARRLDGEQPFELLCAEIGSDAWRRLRGPITAA